MMEEHRDYPCMEIHPLNLRISSELVGASLEFELESCQLQFRLPYPSNPRTLAPKHKDDRTFVRSDNGLFVYGWQRNESTSVPKEILVERAVLLFLDSPELRHYREKPESDCFELVNKLKEVGKRAIQLWLRTLRWKSNDVLNGRIIDYDNSDEKVIVPPMSGKPGGSSSQRFASVDVHPSSIGEEAWRETEQSLQRGEEPPLAFDLFADAVYLAELEDYRRAYLELAVAAEVHIRTRIENTLPSSLDPYMRKEIRLINYSRLLEVFFKQLSEDEREALTGEGGIKSDLKRLSEDRNIIVHQGGYMRSKTTDKAVEFSHEKFSVYRDAVERLLRP